jgi:hypothetical protein
MGHSSKPISGRRRDLAEAPSRRAIMRLVMLVLGAMLLFAAQSTPSLANPCAELAGGGSQAQALNRQLAALRALKARRGCTGRSSGGGFFDVCADITNREAAVRQQIARAGGANAARLAALGCRVTAERRHKRSDEGRAGWFGKGAILFCVRLEDGYYFPAPGSQFSSGDAKLVADQCRYICEGSEVAVYQLPSLGMEAEEMVSVATRRPYGELPKAFAYRDSANFRKCDYPRYVRRVEEARARTVTPKSMDNALIPLPTFRPDVPSGEAPVTEAAFAAIDETRAVRLVGPNFFPQ